MNKTILPRPAKTSYSVLRQIVHWIPPGLPDRLAREADANIRTFSCTSHIVALLYGQLNRAASLNEICDAARLHEPELNRIRGATAPKRNTFSNANRTRDPVIAERLYWQTFDHLRTIRPDFTQTQSHKGFIHRIKRDIFAIDSTTLKLSINCIDWTRHRRKKAAAKTHMRLNIGTRLPAFAVVEDAAHHDSKRADALCAGLHVLREKENMVFMVTNRRTHKDPRILADETVWMSRKGSAEKYPKPLRRITAIVEVDGRDTVLTFITNQFAWSPRTIAELYRARWAIETFFKELKQTLQLADFVGYNEKAVKWQVWIGLLAHQLLRFLKHVAKWTLSFSRLAGTVRAAVWMKIDLLGALHLYGIAGGPKRLVIVEYQRYFQGFERFTSRPWDSTPQNPTIPSGFAKSIGKRTFKPTR